MLKKTLFFVLVSCLCFSAWAAETPSKEGKKSSEPQKVMQTWAGSAERWTGGSDSRATIHCKGMTGTCASSTRNPNGTYEVKAFENGVEILKATFKLEPEVKTQQVSNDEIVIIFSGDILEINAN
ncbi:MAG: hypothetical protein JJT94_14165 [Bernardetiaceae bacterium]|nr:hypothetical protein [Bernardetiaceae bacterium]